MYQSAFYILTLVSVIYITFPSEAMSQQNNTYQAQIEQKKEQEQWTFTACFRNESSLAMSGLSYRFKGIKKGDGGTSNTSQRGKFEAQPGEKISLATIRYNAIKEGTIELTLKILHKETPIARDSLEIKP